MKKNFIFRMICMIFVLCLLFPTVLAAPKKKAEEKKYPLDDYINQIISFKRNEDGALKNGYAVSTHILESVFDFSDAKFIIALSQNGNEDNFREYSYVLTNLIKDKYQGQEKLNTMKAYTGSQMALALLACNVNPLRVDGRNGRTYNFLADNIYNRDSAYPLGKDGVEGYAWGIIAMDAYNYSLNNELLNIREKLLSQIIDQQEEDGTFVSANNTSPLYLSALSAVAMAPYYNNEKRKEEIHNQAREARKLLDEKRKAEGKQTTFEEYEKEYELENGPTLYDYIDESLQKSIDILSKNQSSDGSFKKSKESNVSITAATIIALCTLGIDPMSEKMFIKGKNNLIDGLLKYRQKDGSFLSHKNSDKSVDTSDAMAALVAYKRLKEGKTPLYDFVDKPMDIREESIMLIAENDINNISYLSSNLNVSMYPYICILYEKISRSDREDKEFYLSCLAALRARLEVRRNLVDYINSQGNALLYTEKGLNLNEKRKIKELINLSNTLPEKELEMVKVYEGLKENTKRVDNAIALETLIFSVLLIMVISFSLSLVMLLIKKRDQYLKSVAFMDGAENNRGFFSSKINKMGKLTVKDERMPFETEEDFFDFDMEPEEEKDDGVIKDESLPFEYEGFFDYQKPLKRGIFKKDRILYETDKPQTDSENTKDEVFHLPFEQDASFFAYNSDEEVSMEKEKDNGKDEQLPFEKEKDFFK